MAPGPIIELKDRLDRALNTAVLGAVAAAAGVAAFFFLCVAIFVWTAKTYDTVTACIVLAVLFVVIAAAAAIAIAVSRRRAAEELRRRESRKPQWWQDPAMLAMAAEVAKALGPRRAATLAVLGALVAGVVFSRAAAKP